MKIFIKWFPPSWVQIKADGKVIYIDPAYLKWHFVKYPTNIVYSDWPDEIDGMPEPLEKADLILVTHSHKDHCKAVTVDRLKKSGTVIMAPKRAARIISGSKVVKPGEEIPFEDIIIKVVNAYNTPEGNSTRKVHHKDDGVGYLIRIDDKAIYHAGDTDFIPEMKDLGRVDAAMLPIGGTFTMDITEAARAARAINPNILIPIHYKDADMAKLKREVGVDSGVLVLPMKIGETVELK